MSTRPCKPPYECPKCDYTTTKKQDMRKHFYGLKKPCPALRNDIELTDEIKQYVLTNRVYKVKKESELKKENENLKKQIKEIVNAKIVLENKMKEYNGYYIVHLIRIKVLKIIGIDIYKIGVSFIKYDDTIINKLLSYGEGFEVINISQCNNGVLMEDLIIKEFNKHFVNEQDNKYFSGNGKEMKKIMDNIINNKDEKDYIEKDNVEDKYNSIEDREELVKTVINIYNNK